ncbi:uncharacterized protein LOC144861103 [Branchiostoma floridae x Branchiostoma japonicum]
MNFYTNVANLYYIYIFVYINLHPSMSNKAKRMLILLLIILKEAGPTAACSSSCSSDCDCSSRGLTSVPQDLPTSITTLELQGNAITHLNQSDFLRYKSLRILRLYSNQISMIQNKTFHNLTSLTELSLWDNQLTGLPADIFVGLGNLQYLYLFRNHLTSLPADSDVFMGLGNLQELNFYMNQLTTLPAGIFAGLGNLQNLLLHNNQLTNLTADIFAGLDNLQYLGLHSNQLNSLPAGIFFGLGNLQILWLAHNQLTTLPADIFAGLSNLQQLWISHNQLQTLPPMLYDILGSIDVRSDHPFDPVIIGNNPWQCDCRMAPFRQRMNGSYPFEAEITCAGPANLAGQLLQDVGPENLICEETTPVYSTLTTKRMVVSTRSLSIVSSLSPFHQSTSKAPTMSPTSSNAPTAGSSTGGSTVSTSPWSDHSAKSTPNLPTPHRAPTAGSNPDLSTVGTDSAFGFQSTVTESNAGPTGDGIVLSVPILATLCVCLGIFIICTIACGVWCMYKRRLNSTGTGVSSGNNTHNIRLHTVTHADRIRQSKSPHSDRNSSQHTYNLPNDDPEYDTIADINQSGSPQEDAGSMQGLDSFGHSALPPPLPPENQTGPQAGAFGESGDGYEVPSRSLASENGVQSQGKEDPQSHKYVNSQIIAAAAQDAAADP